MEKYLVYGLGVTGISTIKTLDSMGAKVYVYVDTPKEELNKEFESLQGYKFEFLEKLDYNNLKNIDVMVKSPGIPMDNKNVEIAIKNNVEVISDLELAYRLFPNRNLIAITGTNGKTTTTSLLTQILKTSGKNAKFVGNIGVGMLWEIYNSSEDDYFVIECSSFQLESVNTFRTKTSGLINITPDHIDWHKSMENYIKAKSNIFAFQKESDTLVVNIDGEIVKDIIKNAKCNIIKTSKNEILKDGIYLEDGVIKYNNKVEIIDIIKVSELGIIGLHNVENTMIAIGMAISENIDLESIRKACKLFTAVEHRMEFVREINKVKYYNDSKGTNVDASIKAVESFDKPIILIAGGYDKKADLDEFFKVLKGKVKTIILMGQTREKFAQKAYEYKIPEVYLVENMEEAVSKAAESAVEDDIVLLSPASASWGMYKNFEIRGRHFKKIVNSLGD